MTTGMPELGSKISLISKADIRYEGKLFTVDPLECTIALASVRSFGTEDRETQVPVPAQNQVYDYILFRGSDIKDIRIVNGVTVPHPQPFNDPAIMQLSVPPSLGGPTIQQHPIIGHMGQSYGSFLPMGGLSGGNAIGGGVGSSAAAGLQQSSSSGMNRATSSSAGGSKPNSVVDFIGGVVSRSTTPASVSSRKSIDQSTQAGAQQQRDGGNRRQVRPIQPPRGYNNNNQHQQQRNKSRERKDSHNRVDNQEHGNQNYGRNNQNRGRPQYQNNQTGGYQNNQGGGYHQNHPGGYHQNHQGGGYQFNRGGGWNNQRGTPRGRGRPKPGNFRPGAGTPGQTGNRKNTLKFDSEYDFEQANTEFEELRSKLSKVKIDEAAAPPSAAKDADINGSAATTVATTTAAEVEKKDDSGNETGAGETEQEEEHEVFYDKTKSFFDKISCEAVERAKGKMQRTDWRQERKLNSETFGYAATRRGSYRGRGGYRGNYRGGFRGGYNRYPPQRKNNDQQQQQQQQQQTNQQNNQQEQDVPDVDAAKNDDSAAVQINGDLKMNGFNSLNKKTTDKIEVIDLQTGTVSIVSKARSEDVILISSDPVMVSKTMI